MYTATVSSVRVDATLSNWFEMSYSPVILPASQFVKIYIGYLLVSE